MTYVCERVAVELRRPRVIDILRAASRSPLTVLTAPAGFGKREAVAQWASADRLGSVHTLRLGGDDEDDQAAAVAAQLEDLERVARGVVVFESQGRRIDPAVVAVVARFVELAPPGRYAVISRRSAAPGPLDRILDRRDVSRIDHRDLRFDEEEVRGLLARRGVMDVTEAEVDDVLARTGGWPLAVGAATADLQRRALRDGAGVVVRRSFPQLDGFLRSEVLGGLCERSRLFLLLTSVVSQLRGPLCDAITGGAGSDALLAELERDGLVLRVETDDGPIHRCQPLLRDLLRRELRSSTADDEVELLERAACWNLEQGHVAAAADLFSEGERWGELLEVVDRQGRCVPTHGGADEVLAWLDRIPATAAVWRRGVALRRAVALTYVGRSELAEQVIHDAGLSSLSLGEQVLLDAMRAWWGFVQAAPETSARAAGDVLAAIDQLAPGDVPDIFGVTSVRRLQTLAELSGARSRWCLGETAASRSELRRTLGEHPDPPWRIQALAGLALLEAWSGNLRLADHHASEAWRFARDAGLEMHPSVCDVLLTRGHVLRERGRLEEAEQVLDATMALATTYRRSLTLALLSVERALWHLAAGHPGAGLEVIERHPVARLPTLPPPVAGRLAATELRLHLAAGDLRRACAVPLDRVREPAAAGAGVQLALHRGDPEGAAGILSDWPAGDEPRAGIEHALWAAVVEFHAGQRRSARQRIAAVVVEAQRDGHVRLFLDGGEPVQRLLRAFAPVAESSYVADLVDASASRSSGGEVGLSEREIDVLRYLPTALSNAEIAANLYISLNTLKTHLRSVYRKLDVAGRREAIERAEELGIA